MEDYFFADEDFCASLQREISVNSMPKNITEAFDLGGLKVRLVFSDGTNSTVDVGDYIRRHPHPQYNKYLDPKKFRTFTLDGGNIVWGRNWDLRPNIEGETVVTVQAERDYQKQVSRQDDN
ncbi:MAG: DUF2442 domain-containing protein [Bacteroidales bacterium]|nr:DUF2442 domain-containing protein [Bacteroidales bacterium]